MGADGDDVPMSDNRISSSFKEGIGPVSYSCEIATESDLLCDSKWLQIRLIVKPEFGVDGYVFSHEKRCAGHIIALLPFRYDLKNKSNRRSQLLLRLETTPCWGMNRQLSAITGGMEPKYNSFLGRAVAELKEEAGYAVSPEELIRLGCVRGSKSSDTIYHLFSVNLTGKKAGKASGDGSILERQAECLWKYSIDNSADSLVYTMHYALDKLCLL